MNIVLVLFTVNHFIYLYFSHFIENAVSSSGGSRRGFTIRISLRISDITFSVSFRVGFIFCFFISSSNSSSMAC